MGLVGGFIFNTFFKESVLKGTTREEAWSTQSLGKDFFFFSSLSQMIYGLLCSKVMFKILENTARALSFDVPGSLLPSCHMKGRHAWQKSA